MRVCGIDCGTQITGYGVVECRDGAREMRLVSIASGGICPPRKSPFPERLAFIYSELSALFVRYSPDVVAVEEVFHSVNARSAIRLGHARGVALLAAATAGLTIAEYAPLTIKSAVTGYGLAAKQQVQFMVTRLLSLPVAPEPADAADALAIAICHIHHAQTLSIEEVRAV